METTLWNTYSNEARGRRAVDELARAGVPARRLWLLTRSRLDDLRDEPVGEFGAVADPNAPVGTFANVRRLRRQGAGAFAGDPDRQRQGSFADADRDVVLMFERDGERSRLSGDHGVRRLLRDAALEDPAIDRIVAELHAGNAVVVAQVGASAARDVRGLFDEGGRAA